MLSSGRPPARASQRQRLWQLAAAAVLLVACASTEPRRFPLKDPMWHDTDLQSVSVACHRERTAKDPAHVRCAPKPYWSSLMWDGADNVIFRPASEAVGLYLPGPEAVNVNSMDEVPDSSWFNNRIGTTPMTVADVMQGACDPSLILHPEAAADGTWVIDRGKTEGTTPGFRINVGGRKYLLKIDDPSQPELGSAAQVIGLAIYHAAGFNTPCEQVVYFKPSLLKLLPGLRYKGGNMEVEKDFDRKALDAILAKCSKRGDLIRMEASAWISGDNVGPFRYGGTRRDDPNDVIEHQDRRELRGSRLIAAWIDHTDAREGNSLDSWMADRKDSADSSPGHIVHYMLDTGESLGPIWKTYEQVTRRAGYGYVFDWGVFASDFGAFGIPTHPWDYVEKTPGYELFFYFNVRDFVPDEWVMEYANTAFSRMTERDGAWMARILARFTPDMVHGLAEIGRFTNPVNTKYLAKVLEGRLERILERYLTRLSPIADVRMKDADRLCGFDLAEWRQLRTVEQFQYVAESSGSGSMPVEREGGGNICMRLPHFARDGNLADDSPARYVVVTIRDGVAAGPLRVHLYDLGPVRGYRLVGVERNPN
ncbi:MAG TPA: hypothetical protein VEK07_06670 [Polyangiaceae bacterium]|nr:hypothetical protein [Polyangiaceae bacterium]